MRKNLIQAFASFIVLSLVSFGVGAFFIFSRLLIGPVYIVAGLLGILSLRLFNLNVKGVLPDIIFGILDNGFLVFAAIIGGTYAGVFGAVLGGVVGDTVSDGIGGIFEGRTYEWLKENKIPMTKTGLSTVLGKMIGCLLGAGIGLTLVYIVHAIFNVTI